MSKLLPRAGADKDHNLMAITVNLELKFTRKNKTAKNRWGRAELKTISKGLHVLGKIE